MKIDQRIDELFTKFLGGTCSPTEWEELLVLVAGIEEQDAEVLTQPLSELWERARRGELPSRAHLIDAKKMFTAVVQEGERGKVTALSSWWRLAAAVAGVVLVSGVFYLSHRGQRPAEAYISPEQVQPGSNKAILTLANGQKVELDSARKGIIGRQGNTVVFNDSKGKLSYEPGDHTGIAPAYNTISTARANQYQVVLPDGSTVWLNAASSLRFPTAFASSERSVEMTGEAYFDIKNDPSRPFHLTVNSTSIDVLGTQFNVNAYPDEAGLKTTLVSGAVKVDALGKSVILTPGQEACLPTGGVLFVEPGNAGLASAWKNGFFQFDKAPLAAVMRQIGRWYDLDIRYSGDASERLFKGKLQRSLPLSAVLHLLQKEGVHFTLEGKVLNVTP